MYYLGDYSELEGLGYHRNMCNTYWFKSVEKGAIFIDIATREITYDHIYETRNFQMELNKIKHGERKIDF